MKDVIFDDFQNSVCESLLRHRSILDIMTKLQESEARINRAVAKSVTTCGCVSVEAIKKQVQIDEDDMDMDMETLKNRLQTHMKGSLCDNCRDVLEGEIGNNLFYLTSLCNLLDLNLYDILLKEYEKINTLGQFTLR
jgi:NTP pyrophosphatase (non-canonical NTP hydrolase)